MARFSTRIAGHWLVLNHLRGSTWHLQVLGDTPLEAEVTALDEAEAKSCAVTATIERLGLKNCDPPPSWNPAIVLYWDSREAA